MFKTAVSLENAGKTEIVALDKTGTITSGEPKVTDVLPAVGVSEEELTEAAFALEQKSEHPLAKAILAYGTERGRKPQEVAEFEAVPGNGLTGVCNGKFLAGGNRAFMEKKTAGRSKEAGGALPPVRGACKSGKDTAVFLCRWKTARCDRSSGCHQGRQPSGSP